jgi:hypothetical protein
MRRRSSRLREEECLRIYHCVLKQQYRKKGFYKYEMVALPIPKKYNELMKPYLGKNLEISVKVLPPPQEGFTVFLKLKKSSKTP